MLVDCPYYINYRGFRYLVEEFKHAITEFERIVG